FHDPVRSGKLTVRSGTSNLHEGGDSRRVTQATRHELYRDGDDDYDLCALRVETAFEYSNVTAPVKLPKLEKQSTHLIDGSVAGWGYTAADGTVLSPRLQLLNVSRVDLKDCKHAYRNSYTIHDDDVCYGSDNGWDGACQGDSGGPLVNRDFVLVGIVSFGAECGYSKLPDVYVDVTQFLEWIERTTRLHAE
ncbi:trypsin-4-like, partial [Phymastichus coffea]